MPLSNGKGQNLKNMTHILMGRAVKDLLMYITTSYYHPCLCLPPVNYGLYRLVPEPTDDTLQWEACLVVDVRNSDSWSDKLWGVPPGGRGVAFGALIFLLFQYLPFIWYVIEELIILENSLKNQEKNLVNWSALGLVSRGSMEKDLYLSFVLLERYTEETRQEGGLLWGRTRDK